MLALHAPARRSVDCTLLALARGPKQSRFIRWQSTPLFRQAAHRALAIEGPSYFLESFIETHSRLDHDAGFAADDVCAVEWAWGSFGEELWYGGFIVDLKDGRRAYLDVFAGEDSGWGGDASVETQFLSPTKPTPRLARPTIRSCSAGTNEWAQAPYSWPT
jgi:hypothetical protein